MVLKQKVTTDVNALDPEKDLIAKDRDAKDPHHGIAKDLAKENVTVNEIVIAMQGKFS